MQFESPVFLLLIILLLLGILYNVYTKTIKSSALRFGGVESIKNLPRTLIAKTLPILTISKISIIILLILTLASPHVIQSQVRRFPEGIDIYLALDVSDSMRAEDVKDSNRLETAKSVIREFLINREADRIGLVVFSGESFTLCPLTLDYTVLTELLTDIEAEMGDRLQAGTAIGEAIGTCTNRLQITDSKSKIAILLTDGENNSGSIDPITAASVAKSYGIRIYTIGFGKEGGSLIPVEDTTFGKRYEEKPTFLDEETLKAISNITGARYFRATDLETLRQVYTEIDQLEKTKFQVFEFTNQKDLVAYLLIPASILFGFEILLSNTLLRKIP
ncbi:VWA domain-containing protein [Candidatus Poribacteria bacterium]|nr:VWA domain-containing protein [Candidatus Poribacteria bacterium]